jgi:hypothetical protein
MYNNDFTRRSTSLSVRILLNIYRNISNKSVEKNEAHILRPTYFFLNSYSFQDN